MFTPSCVQLHIIEKMCVIMFQHQTALSGQQVSRGDVHHGEPDDDCHFLSMHWDHAGKRMLDGRMCVCVCVCVCMCMKERERVYVCVYVCVREREREIERV